MTQKFTKNISYMIYILPSCHIIYSHVHCANYSITQLIRLKGNNFVL